MDIQQAIDERKKKMKRLEEEIAALQRAAKLLDETDALPNSAGTQADMASAILENAGKPMHVTDLVSQIKKRFGRTIKSNNLGVMLFRYAKRGSKFYKAKGKPNTYGLIKWEEIPIATRMAGVEKIQ
jgi:hypothetical protein